MTYKEYEEKKSEVASYYLKGLCVLQRYSPNGYSAGDIDAGYSHFSRSSKNPDEIEGLLHYSDGYRRIVRMPISKFDKGMID